MRIAYIILCHTDPEHIRRLTKKSPAARMTKRLFM